MRSFSKHCALRLLEIQNPTSHSEKWGLWPLLFHVSTLLKGWYRSGALPVCLAPFGESSMDSIEIAVYCQFSSVSLSFPGNFRPFIPIFCQSSAGFLETPYSELIIRGTAPVLSLGISGLLLPTECPSCLKRRSFTPSNLPRMAVRPHGNCS